MYLAYKKKKHCRVDYQALLGKWKWNLFYHQDALWVKIIESKYGGWGDLLDGNVPNSSFIWWCDLCAICGENDSPNWFVSNFKWNTAIAYSRFFSLSNQKYDNLHSMGYWDNGLWNWNLE
ncbi:hypothetical protein GYH30_052791 [Glycine max]|uniref:Reverse transcriptase zinc-binding domain-containing protein n=1 Tax=Glycine max TaxID=3847 RepID=A0A0R0EKU6_SOYBN|nr:hypothetical protein JHK87_053282 [Glycine soja]KAH1077430.1 hypothetical protein GYH30_052791 [Glycine max]